MFTMHKTTTLQYKQHYLRGFQIVFSPNVFFAEVPQYTIIYILSFLYKIDSWTDRAFKGFAANAGVAGVAVADAARGDRLPRCL